MPLQFNSLGKMLFSTLGKVWFACCCGKKQWAQNYTNTGCGTCSGGYFSGDWVVDGDPYVLEGGAVQEGYANSCVIDDGANTAVTDGTAICYGATYSQAAFPETPDVGGGPTITSNQAYCETPWRVLCYVSFDFPGEPGRVDKEVYAELGTGASHLCTPGAMGCRTSYPTSDIFCTQAEADAWIAANCPSGNCCPDP